MSEKSSSKINLITCILFFAVLVTFPILTLILPKDDFSDVENRNLQSFPKASASSIKSRKYMNNLETYISDHFAGRINWIKVKSGLDITLGKRERNNIYILNDRLIEKVKDPDYQLIDKSISGINKFYDENNLPVYVMIAPSSADIYKDNAPYNADTVDLKEMTDYVYSNLNPGIQTIDIYSDMVEQKDNYIFYRTDHHWTSFGAYLAYSEAGKKMGYTPVSLDSYDIEHAGTDFLGTFYSKTLYDKITPDTLDIYHCNGDYKVTSVEISKTFGEPPEVYDDIYFREFLDKKDKYSVFTGSNQPIITIKTDCPGPKLLILKDSYAHSYVPFLTQHYSEITMFDLRYVQISYKDIIDVSEYDKVLFLYNSSTFSTDENIKKLNYN